MNEELRQLISDEAEKVIKRLFSELLELMSYERVKNNIGADALPTVNDDITGGYSPGSFWGYQNTRGFICVSNAEGAADWNEIL
jgi:hypothetical protein